MPKIIVRITNGAKLPLKISRGSESERLKMSQKMTNRLIKKVDSKKNITFEDLDNWINEILAPEKINFRIIEHEDTSCKGSSELVHNIKTDNAELLDVDIEGYLISIDKNSDDSVNKIVAIHEFGHLFDSIYNPKFNSLTNIKLFFIKGIKPQTDVIRELFSRSIFKYDESFITIINKLLSTIPDEYAIDTLQLARRKLITEKQQYRNSIKYVMKNLDFENTINIFDKYKSFNFNKKLKFANKLLKERLAIARENIAKKKR